MALVLTWVLAWRMGPASLENPREKQVWGGEDLLLLVVCGVWWTLGVQRDVIYLVWSRQEGWTGALALGPSADEGTSGWGIHGRRFPRPPLLSIRRDGRAGRCQ